MKKYNRKKLKFVRSNGTSVNRTNRRAYGLQVLLSITLALIATYALIVSPNTIQTIKRIQVITLSVLLASLMVAVILSIRMNMISKKRQDKHNENNKVPDELIDFKIEENYREVISSDKSEQGE